MDDITDISTQNPGRLVIFSVVIELFSRKVLVGWSRDKRMKAKLVNNAISENFFHILKTEVIGHYQFQIREEGKQTVFGYIEVFYNR